MVKRGIIPTAVIKRKMIDLIRREKLARIDYIEIVNKHTLERIKEIKPGQTLIALAVYIGKTRLIDNEVF
jgi:pantoate--beta-alanine ligase